MIDVINMFLPGIALTLFSMWGALLWLMHPRSRRVGMWVKLARLCVEAALAVMSHDPKRDRETIRPADSGIVEPQRREGRRAEGAGMIDAIEREVTR